jgi:hypothetical protein
MLGASLQKSPDFGAMLAAGNFRMPDSMVGVSQQPEPTRAPGEMAAEPQVATNDNSIGGTAARLEATTQAWAEQTEARLEGILVANEGEAIAALGERESEANSPVIKGVVTSDQLMKAAVNGGTLAALTSGIMAKFDTQECDQNDIACSMPGGGNMREQLRGAALA